MQIKLLFHIGFHKTGSTWLQNVVFSKNNNFNLLNNFVSPWEDKIVSYLVKTSISEFNVSYFNNLVLNKCKENKVNVISAERLSGHPFSGGYDAESITQKIKISFPTANILIVTREKESFKKSCYKQVVNEGYLGKYKDFVDDKSWKSTGPLNNYFDQNQIINAYNKKFSKVLILEFEEFIQDKKKFVDKIFNFFRIENNINESLYKKNINRTSSNKRIRALRNFNKFKKTEYNKFPIININKRIILYCSIFCSFFFSNKEINKK